MDDFLDIQNAKKKKRNKNIIALIVGIVCFLLVFLLVFPTVRYFTSSFSEIAKNDLVTDNIKKQVAEINQQLPEIVEDGVRLDSVVLKGKRTMGYYATLFDFDSEEIEFDTPAAKDAILQNLRSNREKMRFFIDNDITLLYYYYDENKKLVSEIRIPSSLYK